MALIRKTRGSWWLVLSTVGLAFIVASVFLALSAGGPGTPVVNAQATPTDTPTPTVTPTPNAGCILDIRKSDSISEVPEGGQLTYDIRVDNDGTAPCPEVVVTDGIPTDTDCVSATVVDAPSGVSFDVDGCDTSGDVEWAMDAGDELDDGDNFELRMVVELTSGAEEDDEITNEACVTAEGEIADAACDTETTRVGKPATATPQPTATARPTVMPTVAPPPVVPPVVPPVIPPAVLPTLAPPPTGTGPDGIDFTRPLALALGLAGGSLLLAAGAVRMRRTR